MREKGNNEILVGKKTERNKVGTPNFFFFFFFLLLLSH
jgi:hypothetical protein